MIERSQVWLSPCRNGGRILFSRVNFLCWLLFQYFFHPLVTAVAQKRSQSFCPKCRWQVTPKHTCILHIWLCIMWHGAWLYGVSRTCWDSSSFFWHHCRKYSTLVDIQKWAIKTSHLCRIAREHSGSAWECYIYIIIYCQKVCKKRGQRY